MTDSIDDHQIHMTKLERTNKYGRCDYCGTYSANIGKCPFCHKGEIR